MKAIMDFTINKDLKRYYNQKMMKRWIPWSILIVVTFWSVALQWEKIQIHQALENHRINMETISSHQEQQEDNNLLLQEEVDLIKVHKLLQLTSDIEFTTLELKPESLKVTFSHEATRHAQRWISLIKKMGLKSFLKSGGGNRTWNTLEVEVNIP